MPAGGRRPERTVGSEKHVIRVSPDLLPWVLLQQLQTQPVRIGNAVSKRLFWTVFLSVPPAAALLLFSPVAVGMVPWNPYIRELHWTHFVLPLPFYVGLLAAPGFLYVVYVSPRSRELSTSRRWWLRVSLVAAMACSLAGVWGAYWMALFAVPSLPSLAISGWLLWRLER